MGISLLVLHKPINGLFRHAELSGNPRRTAAAVDQALRRRAAPLPCISEFISQTFQVAMGAHQLLKCVAFFHAAHLTMNSGLVRASSNATTTTVKAALTCRGVPHSVKTVFTRF